MLPRFWNWGRLLRASGGPDLALAARCPSRSGDRQRVSISRIPATHRGQDWQEVLSRRGKPMRETGRSLAILIALKQSSAGEGHEPLCQDIGRDREVLPEIVEARDAGAGVAQDQHAPGIAQHV